MIIHLKDNIDHTQAIQLADTHQGHYFTAGNLQIIVLSSKIKRLPKSLSKAAEEFFIMDSDIQLASKEYQQTRRSVSIGSLEIGGNSNHTLMIAGPCSVESWEQASSTAALLKELGVNAFRGGSFKPRTSPYTFQGLGEKGIEILLQIKEQYAMQIVTEVKDSTHVDLVIEHADVVQIGAKAMYDQSILKRCGQSKKPVLLKRGFGTTLQEFVQAAEFILSEGNPNVILCERGIRTFETKTRFTLDLTGVAYLKEFTNLPIVVDTSHAMGYRYGVPDLTRAATAMGVDGLLLETHPTPENAKSDAAQQLNFEEFTAMYHSLGPIASAIGRKII